MELSSSLFCVLTLICSLMLERVSAVLEHNDIRLVNVPDGELCEGRLEIYHSTEFARAWFAVCDKEFSQEELSVVCRQLGCPYTSPKRTSIARYGEQSGYMKSLAHVCSGGETDLTNCAERDMHMCDFLQEDLVGVRCTGEGHSTQPWMAVTVTLSLIALILL